MDNKIAIKYIKQVYVLQKGYFRCSHDTVLIKRNVDITKPYEHIVVCSNTDCEQVIIGPIEDFNNDCWS